MSGADTPFSPPTGVDNLRRVFAGTFPTEQEMEPKHALAAYRACSQTNAQLIEHILAGREGFVLAYNEAEELDDMVGVLVDQIDS